MPQSSTLLLDELVRVSGELDRVIGDVQLGGRSRRDPHREQDAIHDRVECLAADLRAAVRGVPPRLSAAPLWSNGAGQAAW